MSPIDDRQKVHFTSAGAQCAAWYYPGTTGACVIMAGGGGVTKEPGTDLFAAHFNRAGFAVLAFDYRHLGESGAMPRQLVHLRHGLEDWDAAIAFAQSLADVDPTRLAIWGFSLSGGHVLRVAARHRDLGAAIAQTPTADGPRAARSAARHQRPIAMLRMTGRSVLDGLGGVVRREPILVPLAGAPGTVSMLTRPDGLDGNRALNPGDKYPEWRQVVAARSVLPIAFYRPGRVAADISCPLLVLVCEDDQTALAEPAAKAANRAPNGELVRMPGGHYEPFLRGHEQAVEAELEFLRRHLLGGPEAPAGPTAASGSAS